MFGVLIALCALLVIDVSTLRALLAYVALASIVAVVTYPGVHVPFEVIGAFAAATVLKLIVAPAALAFFLTRTPGARDLNPAPGFAMRVLISMVLIGAGNVIAQSFPLVSAGSLDVLLTGLVMLLVYRNLAGTMIGLLVFGCGLGLLGNIAGPALPSTLDLGAAFDALLTTFIALAVSRELSLRHVRLDVAVLRRLRG